MSLLEWLGESFDPGDVGSVEFGNRGRGRRPRAAVIACLLVSLLLLTLWGYALWRLAGANPMGLLIGAGLTGLYLLVAYFVHPQPDLDNIGWLGGMVDHPFRYSDDLNRSLIFLVIFLWPGRFVSESLVDGCRLLAHLREHEPRP